ncbi:MAG: HAD-IIB family hydrolase [Candidatus Sumerlaeota bacterium]|nr:HAD-IIB family hydrolase [Candidatus Sumerlaeota bacterium]
MLPLSSPSFAESARLLRFVFTDLDDTLTTGGKLRPESFDAMWNLHDAGVGVVVVTGRPAGWCDHLARMWPVEAVVGENGAFYFHMQDGKLRKRRFYEPKRSAEVFARVIVDVAKEVPGAAVSADQQYREFDLAIDFREDVPPLPREDILRIVEIFERHGAHAKISSIHVNGWLEDFNKLTGCRRYVEERFGRALDSMLAEVAFVGDSPNDEDLFAAFPVSIAVANLANFADLLKHRPAYVATQRGAAGFAEAAEAILVARQ